MIVGIVGFFCFGFIFGPFAIYRGHKALSLIAQYNVGHQHSGNATAGKIIGIVVTVLNVLVLAFYAVLICGAASQGM